MPSGLPDTNHAAEQVQIELLRQAGMVRRVELAADLTRFAIDGAYMALRRRYPEANDLEIRLLFAEQQYGPALAACLRAVLTPQAGGRDLLPCRPDSAGGCV